MSRCVVQELTCPLCGGKQKEKVFVSVNGARLKAAADRIIDGTWGEVACLKCGGRYQLDTPLLFTDVPRGLWIVQYERSERNRFSVLEAEASAIFQREFIERPPNAIRTQALFVNRRICFGRAQLADKLLARREGIDDRTLECVKLVLMRDYLAELFPYGPTEFYLRRADYENLTLVAATIAEPSPVLEATVKRRTLDEIAGDQESFRVPFPELFNKLYVNASRYWTDEADARIA